KRTFRSGAIRSASLPPRAAAISSGVGRRGRVDINRLLRLVPSTRPALPGRPVAETLQPLDVPVRAAVRPRPPGHPLHALVPRRPGANRGGDPGGGARGGDPAGVVARGPPGGGAGRVETRGRPPPPPLPRGGARPGQVRPAEPVLAVEPAQFRVRGLAEDAVD